MHTVIPSKALGAKALDLELQPAELNGWKEGRNFRLDSSTAAHRAAAVQFCRDVSTDALEQMASKGIDLVTLQAKYAGLVAENSRLRMKVRRSASL
jgi:hypothetical protein